MAETIYTWTFNIKEYDDVTTMYSSTGTDYYMSASSTADATPSLGTARITIPAGCSLALKGPIKAGDTLKLNLQGTKYKNAVVDGVEIQAARIENNGRYYYYFNLTITAENEKNQEISITGGTLSGGDPLWISSAEYTHLDSGSGGGGTTETTGKLLFGSSAITKVYLGSTEISKLCIGSTVLYNKDV